MNRPSVPLEIEIQLHSGNIDRFVQNDPELAQRILKQLHPDRLFTQRQIILAGEHSLSVYQTSSIVRVDFIMERYPDWAFPPNITDIVEITESEFLARFNAETTRSHRRFVPGEPLVAYTELELCHGGSVFREIHLLPPQPEPGEERIALDRNVFFQQLFQAPRLHFRRREGGAILINPDYLARMTFYPGPSDMPSNAWNADFADSLPRPANL